MVDFNKLRQRKALQQATMFQMPPSARGCKIDLVSGALAITSPYNQDFVAALKATIPGSDRKWEPSSKRWMVTPFHGLTVQRLLEQHYGATVSLPNLQAGSQQDEIKLLDIRYIGAAKTREDGAETAFAWTGGDWGAIFPKSVLLAWFGQTARPDESQTLYGVLGVSQSVDDVELKKAWRRMARTWHPDVSKEPGSREQFQAIQEAYQILSDAKTRGKYDAGLAFEAMTKAHSSLSGAGRMSQDEWRAPLRCGLILCKGQDRLGRFVVSEIMQWADIVNAKGEILVTSWASGDDGFTESWVEA